MGNFYKNELDTISSALIDTAFNSQGVSRADRLSQMESISSRLGSFVLESWRENEHPESSYINAAATLAIAPSMQRITAEKPFDNSINIDVADNFQILCEHLNRSGLSRSKDPSTVGSLSEVAVMGTIWWGIANGYLQEGTHLKPSTLDQDASDRYGKKNGFDATLCMPKQKKVKLQIKTHQGYKKSAQYEDDIVVVSLDMLNPCKNQSMRPNTLIRALAEGDTSTLDSSMRNFLSILNPEKMHGVKFDTAKYIPDVTKEFSNSNY